MQGGVLSSCLMPSVKVLIDRGREQSPRSSLVVEYPPPLCALVPPLLIPSWRVQRRRACHERSPRRSFRGPPLVSARGRLTAPLSLARRGRSVALPLWRAPKRRWRLSFALCCVLGRVRRAHAPPRLAAAGSARVAALPVALCPRPWRGRPPRPRQRRRRGGRGLGHLAGARHELLWWHAVRRGWLEWRARGAVLGQS